MKRPPKNTAMCAFNINGVVYAKGIALDVKDLKRSERALYLLYLAQLRTLRKVFLKKVGFASKRKLNSLQKAINNAVEKIGGLNGTA